MSDTFMHMSLPWWELILRGVVVYVFLIVLLRLTGKRQVGQLAPFDLVLLLVLSNAVQNSMNGGDNSLVGGLISATTLIALNFCMGFATFKSRRLEALVEGRPQVLIHDGKLYDDVMAKSQLTHHELHRRADGVLVQHLVTCALGGGFRPDALRDEVRTANAYAGMTDAETEATVTLIRELNRSRTKGPDFT